MVKQIVVKRANKNVTVEQFWQMRDSLKKNKSQKNAQPTAQIDLSRRHRFKKLTQERNEVDINIGHHIDLIKVSRRRGYAEDAEG